MFSNMKMSWWWNSWKVFPNDVEILHWNKILYLYNLLYTLLVLQLEGWNYLCAPEKNWVQFNIKLYFGMYEACVNICLWDHCLIVFLHFCSYFRNFKLSFCANLVGWACLKFYRFHIRPQCKSDWPCTLEELHYG